MKSIFKLLALVVALISFESHSQMSLFGNMDQAPQAANGSKPKPLMWQKIEFEEKLTKSLKNDLSVILPADQFLIQVELRLKDDDDKKKSKSTGRETASEGPSSVLEGNDLISKLGVDNQIATPDELSKQDSLFDNISSFSVTLLIDESVDKDREATAQTLLKKIVPKLKETRPKIKIERLALVDSKAAEDAAALKAGENSSFMSTLKEFKEPFGRIAALALFGLMLFLVAFFVVGKLISLGESAVGTYKEWVSAQQAAEQASATSLEISGNVDSAGGVGSVASAEDDAEDEAASRIISSSADKNLAGIDKFRDLVAKDAKTAALFVRQWLKFMPHGAVDALVVLTRFLHPNDLVQLFGLMSPKERKDMSKMLNAPLSRDALGRADMFLNNQLILDLIVPKPELAPDIQELIFAVTAEEVVAVFKDNPTLASEVMSLLPSAQISSIATQLDDEICQELYPLLAKCKTEDAVKNIETIKKTLNGLRGDEDFSDNPFIESIPDLMPDASIGKERLLYNVLVDSKQWKMIKDLSEESFPSSLISDLPVELVKLAFLKLSNPKRAELIMSRGEGERQTFYSAVGEPGKKLRDMLDLEIKQIESDEDSKAQIEENKDAIWTGFVKIVRSLIKTDSSFSKASGKVLSEWVEKLKSGEASDGIKEAA